MCGEAVWLWSGYYRKVILEKMGCWSPMVFKLWLQTIGELVFGGGNQWAQHLPWRGEDLSWSPQNPQKTG